MNRFIKFIICIVAAFSFVATYAQNNEIILLAHRGGCGEGMENVEGTFKRSLDAGIRAFEMDVRITKDGKIVLQHDGTLKRTAGIDKAVEDMTEKELRAVTLKDGSKLMFLDEFLKLMGNYSGLFIEFEMKCGKYSDKFLIESGYCDKVAKAVMKAQPEGSTYVMTSFDTRALRYIREHYPTADLALITGEGCTKATVRVAEALGVKRIAARLDKTTREDMKYAHKRGMKVNLWPGREDYSIVRAWALGADVHCTDYPIRIKKQTEKDAHWIKIK